VKFREPNKRERATAHIHPTVKMPVKHAYDPSLTLKLRDRILEMFKYIHPIDYFPPRLQYFKSEHAESFKELDRVGEFTVEFILAVAELMGIQEKTNYPRGSLTESLYRDFGVKDRFSVIQRAVLKRLR